MVTRACFRGRASRCPVESVPEVPRRPFVEQQLLQVAGGQSGLGHRGQEGPHHEGHHRRGREGDAGQAQDQGGRAGQVPECHHGLGQERWSGNGHDDPDGVGAPEAGPGVHRPSGRIGGHGRARTRVGTGSGRR